MDGFDWQYHQKELDKILFKDFPFMKRESEEHRNFWKFFERYHKFNSKHTKNRDDGGSSSITSSDHAHCENDGSSPFATFPKRYDKSYRISFSVMTDDLAYRLRQLQQRREDDGRRLSSLTMQHMTYVRTALRHYVNFLQKKKFDKILKIRQDQSNLPIYQFKQHILSTISRHQVVLIAGDTGCGKSTQVPQYLLSAGYSQVACTQPRRIACLSLAKRVSYETLSEYGTQIAYQVRFEGSKTMATKVLFLTEGLLLRQLSTDPTLSWYNIVIVDEVHERHVHGDFLLGVLRLLADRRADLKLIMMSATINIELFSEYFQGAPVIRVPGRLYPIDMQYNPIGNNSEYLHQKSQRLDPKPYLRIMQQIDSKYLTTERGDLLIFVSGMNEIATLLLEAKAYTQSTGTWIVLPLHSALSIEEQDKVFDIAPDGVRKCVISTNIAETSITIDGIRFVIDSGKVKEMGYDSTSKMSRLQEFWISKASAEQRKGRAGRTGPGVCYRMYSESDYDSFSDYSTPEIQRVPLESLVLQAADLKLGSIRKFPFIEPPATASIENAIGFLKEQGALYSSESLTPIGRMLAKLPVDVVIGKMLIMGSLFHVIDPVLIIAAGLSVQSPFTRSSFGQDEASTHTVRQPLESEHGDPFTLLNAFDQWIEIKGDGVKASSSWCKRRGIEQQRFYEMVKLREQFRGVLEDHGLLFEDSYEDEVVGESRGRGRVSKWSRLSDNQQRELRDMKKRQRSENKKKKVLKMDSEGGAQSDSDGEGVSLTADLKHLELHLLHDVTQLQESSSSRRAYTLKDINLLKVVISSGLYPHVAIADESNSSRKGSELIFHTKSKGFVVIHPTSVFVTNPEYLMKEGSDDVAKKRPQLLAYEKLLETNRPYIVNGLRVPALQTLLLCSHDIDTDGDCKRFVIDQWLEMCMIESNAGQEIVSIIQLLRSTWIKLLEMKLEAKEKQKDTMWSHDTASNSADTTDMEDLLGSKLAEFLDTDYKYTLNQISSSTRPHLYKGPSTAKEALDKSEDKPDKKVTMFTKRLNPHHFKGGWCITEYLTYDCLVDASSADAASSVSQHLRRVWVCPCCHDTLIVNMAEQLSHSGECELLQRQNNQQKKQHSGEQRPDILAKNCKDYYCPECDKVFKFSAVDILRHKKSHKHNN